MDFLHDIWQLLTKHRKSILSIASLITAVLALLLSYYIHKQNDKFLRYSFWLDRKHQELDPYFHKKKMNPTQRERYENLLTETIDLRERFEKEFPDPTK